VKFKEFTKYGTAEKKLPVVAWVSIVAKSVVCRKGKQSRYRRGVAQRVPGS
jgi:hypothetical protein